MRTGAPVDVGRLEKMSKSKKNVVDLDDIVETYGADTARFYLFSDSPPDGTSNGPKPASTASGATSTACGGWCRNRVCRCPRPAPRCRRTFAASDRAAPAIHKTIAAVTDDLDKFRFNRAVARIHELTNALEDISTAWPGAGVVLREGIETATRLIGPMMPHLAEEMWQTLGHDRLIVDAPWPQPDPELTRDEQVTLAVQVNGKLRGTIDLPRDAPAKDARGGGARPAASHARARGPAAEKDRCGPQPHRQRCRLIFARRCDLPPTAKKPPLPQRGRGLG